MIKKLQQLVPCFGLFICSVGFSQSYIGHQVDNYSGLHGVLMNPSNVVDSRMRTDINLFSQSALAGSDYFDIDFNSLLNDAEGFDFDEGSGVNPRDSNNFFLNIDILGPSFMFNLSPKSSIAFTSRGRGFFNLNNVNGTLYESLDNGFDQNQNFNFEMEDFNGSLHAWAEIGLTYGRIIMERKKNFLKAGVTLKYLQGAGHTFINAPVVTGEYNADATSLTTVGVMTYGSSQGFDTNDVDVKNLGSGFGADVGFAYEYRPHREFDSITSTPSDYKLKLGLSVTDIGSITYNKTTINSYDVNSTIDANSFNNNDFDEVLDEQYEFTEEVGETKVQLPTAVHALIDYNIRKRLYVSVQSSLSLVAAGKEQANRIINNLTVSPRLETRWLSIYLPVNYRQYDGYSMGAGIRLGPLTIGSGSIITNYLSGNTKTADIYFGLKIPVYQKMVAR